MDGLSTFIHSGWWAIVLQLIGAASLFAAITPNKYDNVILKFLREALDVFAANFGNATNAAGSAFKEAPAKKK